MTDQLEAISDVWRMYRSNRFLDAYQAARRVSRRAGIPEGTVLPEVRPPEATPPGSEIPNPPLASAGAGELLLASRLAVRLGGLKLSRFLFRTAARRFPDDPGVKVASRWMARRRRPLLDVLRESLSRECLDSGDPELDAHWLADGAFFWAGVRDFARAHRLLDRAAGHDPGEGTPKRDGLRFGDPDPWLTSVRAHVLFCQDRWDEAIRAVRAAWAASPNRPSTAGVLARVLMRANLVDEAAELLSAAADGQSYETLLLLAYVRCAQAERSGREVRLQIAARTVEQCRRLEELTPLRDRFSTQQIAMCRLDLAMQAEDADAAAEQAALLPMPIYRQVSRRLRERASRGQGGGLPHRLLLPHQAVFQKQDRCLPTSIAAIAGSFGATLDADELAKAITYRGTSIWRALSWLRANGYAAKAFILTQPLCVALLERGIPFVYTFNTSLDDSHATAAVGFDEAAGVLLYHDPAAERFGHVLLDQIGESEHPLGPFGLAFVPVGREGLLEAVPEPDARLGEWCQEFWHAAGHSDLPCLAEIVGRLERSFPDSPVMEALRAWRQALTNELPAGIAALEGLCRRYPNCIELQRILLGGLNRTRNTARVREFLGEIVRRGRMPGISDVLPWRYPPASCLTRYADLEGLTAEGFARARELLRRHLEREPACALAYHVLGDVYVRQGQIEQAALPYRLASLLGPTEEHFAREAFASMRMRGSPQEALAFVRERADQLGKLIDGGPPWMTLILAAEDCGDVDGAIAAAEEARAARPLDAAMLAFLTQFWVRMGRWDVAGELLGQLEAASSRQDYLEAGVHYYRLQGQWTKALELCQEWVVQCGDQIEPHRALVALLRNRRTVFEVARTARAWAEQRPGDEEFEFVYYDLLRESFQEDQQMEFVRARLRRNELDGWAWRELALLLISRAECRPPAAREPLLPEIRQAVERAVKLAPREAATLCVQARLAEMQGEWEKTIDLLLGSLRIEPGSDFAYARAWEDSANLPRAAQEDVLRRLEERLLLAPGPLHAARTLALGIASRLGSLLAEAAVRRWMSQRPGDPELIEAHADVLLEHGRGRTDAAQAAAELEEALRHYPQHFDLRMSLAHACSKTLQEDKRRDILTDSLKSWPLNSGVRGALAAGLDEQGDRDAAARLLEEGIALNPQDPGNRIRLAGLQRALGDLPAAVATLVQALELLPENVALRRELVQCLCQGNDAPRALEVIAEGLKLYPQSPVFWHMRAEAMVTGSAAYDARQAETALRKALELNGTYYDAADQLAWLLAGQHRFDEAVGVIRSILPMLPNAAAALGRLAWITWVRGQKRPAVDEMAGVLEAHPDYRWGWMMLMNWLEELDAPDLTCRLLEQVPPAVRADPEITARRLGLLGKAKLSEDKLSAAWTAALEDFPRNEDLWERRFDMLADGSRWDAAEDVLGTILAFCGQSPFALVRKVRLAAYRGRHAAAVEAAMEIFRQEVDGWPSQATWHHLCEAGAFDRAAQAVIDALAAGERLCPGALCRMVGRSAGMTNVLIEGKRRGRAAVLRWLADRMIGCAWDETHAVLAAVLEELSSADRKYVEGFRRRNRELCRTSTRLWQSIGYHLVVGANPAAAREWVSDWRDRSGVGMTAVSYYRLSFGPRPNRKDWPAIREASRDALDRLPEDKTLLLHVAALGEMLLAMGQCEEFLQVVGRYRGLMESADGRYWLPPFYVHSQIVPRLVMFADLLECGSREQAVKIFREICRKPRQPVVYAAAFKQMARWTGYLRRAAISWGLA